MKNLLLTICIGEESRAIGDFTHNLMRDYANKVGAEFLVISEPNISLKYSHYEKFQIYDLLERYDRVLYVDNDALIKKSCPNLFDIVPEDKIGIFNEGPFLPWEHVLREAADRYKIPFKTYAGISYNTGVMVVSKCHRNLFIKPREEYSEYVGHYVFEQPYLTLKIFELEYKVHELNYKFNRLEYMDRVTGESRFSSHILHYAGIPNRASVISEDIKELDKEKEYPLNILMITGGGCGDQIAAEPVMRYVREVMYPKDNVRIISDWPELFKHLDPNCCKRNDFKMDAGYYTMETLPSDKSILWKFLSQAICHTTDFASISCLRSIIPDELKTIKLPVKERSFSKLNRLLKNNLDKYILVHPGKGWPSKTFPKIWWEEVIKGLRENYEYVAVFGKYINEDQGYVDVEIDESVLDLRDLLDIEDVVALISKARCVVSNDSMPIHAAGAFDNYIVLIPSCKHPDHVLPYRRGLKSYKAIALYKKLICDYLNHRPTNIEGETIDKVVGDIMDYLPDPYEVIDNTLRLINDFNF